MNPADLLAALALPDRARVDQRVPKKLLLENGAPTAADRRLIRQGIEELRWVATLKPDTIGVRIYRDTVREYLEIAVLNAQLRSAKRITRLSELIHRAIPYPVLLLTTHDEDVILSLAHKRWSQAQTEEVVSEDIVSIAFAETPALSAHGPAFLARLSIAAFPTSDLYTLYQAWINAVTALEAAAITDRFSVTDSPAQAAARRQALVTYREASRELAALRTQARREKQISRLVDLNIAAKRLETKLATLKRTLLSESTEAL